VPAAVNYGKHPCRLSSVDDSFSTRGLPQHVWPRCGASLISMTEPTQGPAPDENRFELVITAEAEVVRADDVEEGDR